MSSTIVITVLGAMLGGGFLGFIQFLISRKDNKKEEGKNILKAINDLRGDVQSMSNDMERFKASMKRSAILRFNDELINDITHEHESFMEILDTIEEYDNYCNSHPDFPNGRTIQACKNIKHVYEKLFDKQKF